MPPEPADTSLPENRGVLIAYGAAFKAAVERLTEEAADDLEDSLQTIAEKLRALHDGPVPHPFNDYCDHLERLALLVRYRSATAHPFPEEPTDCVIMCLRCEVFPIPWDTACPECGTHDFLHLVSIG